MVGTVPFPGDGKGNLFFPDRFRINKILFNLL